MKKILFLTNLEKESIVYLEYALSFAKLLEAEIHICYVSNTLQTEKITSDKIHPFALFYNTRIEQEDQKIFDVFKNEVEEFISSDKPNNIPVFYHLLKGDFIESVNDFCQTLKIDLTIIKTNTNGKMHNFLYHSHAIKLIQEINSPILVLPRNIECKEVKKMTIASMLKSNEMEIIEKMYDSYQKKGIDFSCVYFSKKNENLTKFKDFKKFKLDIIEHSSFENGIKKFAVDNQIDVIGVFHRDLSLWSRLIHKSFTESIIYELNKPILVLHS